MKFPRATRLVIGVAREDDAETDYGCAPQADEKYGLTVHPEKTRLVPFERPDRVPDRTDPNDGNPRGLSIFWGLRTTGPDPGTETGW